MPCSHLVAPSASPFHSGRSGCRRELNVGSPPQVSSMPSARSFPSVRSPASQRAVQVSSMKGAVGRTSCPRRPTRISNRTSSATTSVDPSIGAASRGRAVQASGMCPSPHMSPLVASRPTQPPPGRNTSAHACRSTTSRETPFGSFGIIPSSRSCTRYPETNRAASPRERSAATSNTAESRQLPRPCRRVSSGVQMPGSSRMT